MEDCQAGFLAFDGKQFSIDDLKIINFLQVIPKIQRQRNNNMLTAAYIMMPYLLNRHVGQSKKALESLGLFQVHGIYRPDEYLLKPA